MIPDRLRIAHILDSAALQEHAQAEQAEDRHRRLGDDV